MKKKTLLSIETLVIASIIALILMVPFITLKLKDGIVIKKWFEPSKKLHSIGLLFVPHVICDNEDWCVAIRGVTTMGDTVCLKYYVSQEVYDTLSVGKSVCIDERFNTEDCNNTQEVRW